MLNLEELRQTIDTIHDMQTVVRTMKALSSVSIHQYEDALRSLHEYQRTVEMGLFVALQNLASERPKKITERDTHLLAIVFGTDRGLCGRFNDEIADHAIDKMNGFHIPRENRLIISVGARCEESLRERHHDVTSIFSVPSSVAGITPLVQDLLLNIADAGSERQLQHVLIFHQQHLGTGSHQPRMLHLLPVDEHKFASLREQHWPSRSLPLYTMDQTLLFKQLLEQYLFILLYRSCADSLASEHDSRLLAMQEAEHNIEEKLEELNLAYRQRRQTQITEELLDVVAGYEVLIKERPVSKPV